MGTLFISIISGASPSRNSFLIIPRCVAMVKVAHSRTGILAVKLAVISLFPVNIGIRHRKQKSTETVRGTLFIFLNYNIY